ncbi:MAG: diguanylate cyclase [Azoarcus sp.]|nr:diguanylate cyclase [Azoarcus sp.]
MASHAKKTLNFKISLFFFAVSVTLIVVLTAISLFAFRQFAISAATEHLRTAAEIVQARLMETPISDIKNQENFLHRLAEIQNLRSVHVVLSPVVNEQIDTERKSGYVPDQIEKNVLQTGKPEFEISENNGETLFRGTIPYTTGEGGDSGCLQCQLAQPGAVLGAVTMIMPITTLRHNGLVTIATIIGAVILAVIILFILLYCLLRPISATASAIEHAVQDALDGNFKNEVEQKTHDEIGQIASDMNRLLKFLDAGINKINHYISQLVVRQPKPGENLLLATIDMVENMAHISQYKFDIDTDESKFDVYHRLLDTINGRFLDGQGEFSIYETSNDSSELHPILVGGMIDTPCRWCDQKILTDPKSCRVFHSGRTFNAFNPSDVCYCFKQGDDTIPRYPLCFPIHQSGAASIIVQLVVKETDKDHILANLPYIRVYLADTAPVLEVRRLMETLRESSLRDPMTGLKNRRFLEEYIDTLTANVRRKQTNVAILMLDLDHFKMVNDTYGHDAGDAVLKALANVIKITVRASDIVIRYGGEEFMVVLQDASSSDALNVAEKIRASVAAMQINHNGVVLQKTISIGIASFHGDSCTFWQAVKFADVALYHAKEAGRNRVQHFTSDMWSDNQEY